MIDAYTLQVVKDHLPHFFASVHTLEGAKKLPSFHQDLCHLENIRNQPFEEMPSSLQDGIIFLRLRQLIDICRLNPAWKERINAALGSQSIDSTASFRAVPVTQKEDFIDLFGGERKGVVQPLKNGGFLVAASGGTSSGQPSQILYSLTELQETYQWAGHFIGKHISTPRMRADVPKWLGTTLADSQLWSSGTMVGGVLQNVPDVNYLGIGPMSKKTFSNIMSYPGDKCLMGISADIAALIDYGDSITEQQRHDLKILLYGSGPLTDRTKSHLRKIYPNVNVLSFFAATQAETIGLQLDPDSIALSSVPGLHFIEILKEDGTWAAEGEVGDLVITRLFGNAAPILRLNLGDRVRRLPSSIKSPASLCFEYVGRSGDFVTIKGQKIYLTDLLSELETEMFKKGLPSLSNISSELQFHFYEKSHDLSLLLAVENPRETHKQFTDILGQSLILTSEDSSFSPLSIRIVDDGSPLIHRTSVGKTPFVHRLP